MNDPDIRALLKSSLPLTGDAELQRDLWPDMLRRIASAESHRIKFAPVDWAIAGLVAASIFIFPNLIPSLLYHL